MKHKNTKTTKMLTAALSLLLILALTLAGCAYPSDIADGSTSAATTVTTTTEPVVTTARPDGLEKVYCPATLEDDFADDVIIIVVFPEYNTYPYTPEDFAEIGCVEVRELMYDEDDASSSRIIALTLSIHSKENVLSSIKILEQRDDIWSAEPNYRVTLHETPNDTYYISGNQWAIDQIDLPAA